MWVPAMTQCVLNNRPYISRLNIGGIQGIEVIQPAYLDLPARHSGSKGMECGYQMGMQLPTGLVPTPDAQSDRAYAFDIHPIRLPVECGSLYDDRTQRHFVRHSA